jgi:hypothetical protein
LGLDLALRLALYSIIYSEIGEPNEKRSCNGENSE